jgi:large subunit ribosomal protein L17
MRHRNAGKQLGRNASHRLALMRNLALALFRHERIITTLAKAKAMRPFVEKLITLAKRGDLHARRLVIARLGPMRSAEVRPPEDDEDAADSRTIVQKLFQDIGPRFKDRPGGYTRVIKRSERRLGDGGQTAFIELLKAGEVKVRVKQKQAAPAPRVTPETPPTPPHAAETPIPPAEAPGGATPPPSP